MSPLGILSALIALYLGAAGPKFWWKGLTIVGVLAVVFVMAGIIAMRGFSYPLALNVSLPPLMVAQMIATVLGYMLLLYGVGFGTQRAVKRYKQR